MPLTPEELEAGHHAHQRVKAWQEQERSLINTILSLLFFLCILDITAILNKIQVGYSNEFYIWLFISLFCSFLYYKDAQRKRRYRADLAFLERLGQEFSNSLNDAEKHDLELMTQKMHRDESSVLKKFYLWKFNNFR